MNRKKILFCVLISCFLLLIMSCEGDSYCIATGSCYDDDWHRHPFDSYSNNYYLIECLEDEVPVALANTGSYNDYLSGSIGGISFTAYDYERNSNGIYYRSFFYGIFCLEKGENTYSLYSHDYYKEFAFRILKLDTNNDGKYYPRDGNDEEPIISRYCNGSNSNPCEEPITGSFTLE